MSQFIKKKKKLYIKRIQRASVNGEEGSAVVPHLMAGVHILRCQVDALFLSPNIYESFSVCSFAGIQVTLALLFEIDISDVCIFAALRKEVQLVLYESVCAVRTQSELSGSPTLLVSTRLHTQTVFTQTILRQQLSLTIAFNNAQVWR